MKKELKVFIMRETNKVKMPIFTPNLESIIGDIPLLFPISPDNLHLSHVEVSDLIHLPNDLTSV